MPNNEAGALAATLRAIATHDDTSEAAARAITLAAEMIERQAVQIAALRGGHTEALRTTAQELRQRVEEVETLISMVSSDDVEREYCIVPVEMTDEMVDAAVENWGNIRDMWAAMLALPTVRRRTIHELVTDATRLNFRRQALEEVRPLIEAAHGLSFGDDWNAGAHALTHGYRQKLLDALPAAIRALADKPAAGGADA